MAPSPPDTEPAGPTGHAPDPKPPCVRANASLAVACVGLAVAVVFGALSKTGGDDMAAGGQLLGGVAFLVLGVLAFFQRSIETQVWRFGRENDELRDTRQELDAENAELKGTRERLDAENRELVEVRRKIDAENEELRGTRERLDAENKELDAENKEYTALNASMTTKMAAMAGQIRNLNKLHNDSVAMIRQLATYGDECKDFGRELGDIKDDLRETDDSLGLTASELDRQVKALSAVAAALAKK